MNVVRAFPSPGLCPRTLAHLPSLLILPCPGYSVPHAASETALVPPSQTSRAARGSLATRQRDSLGALAVFPPGKQHAVPGTQSSPHRRAPTGLGRQVGVTPLLPEPGPHPGTSHRERPAPPSVGLPKAPERESSLWEGVAPRVPERDDAPPRSPRAHAGGGCAQRHQEEAQCFQALVTAGQRKDRERPER